MSERDVSGQALSEPATSKPATGRPERPGRSRHAEKFQLALALLVVVAIGAIAIAVVAAQAPRVTTRPWAPFKPKSGGTTGALEIANYISPGYRIVPTQSSTSIQLAVVSVSPLTGSTLVVKGGPSDTGANVVAGNTLVFTFCGLGPNCTIPGTPSAARMLYVRTEALEISLYALHYLHDVDNVVTMLPPTLSNPSTSTSGKGKGKSSLSTTPPASLSKAKVNAPVALAVNRASFAPVLKHPITEIYPARLPALGGVISPQNESGIDLATSKDLFSPTTETASDGSQLLVLTQLPAQ